MAQSGTISKSSTRLDPDLASTRPRPTNTTASVSERKVVCVIRV